MPKNSDEEKIGKVFTDFFRTHLGVQSEDVDDLHKKLLGGEEINACVAIINLKIKSHIDLKKLKEILDNYLSIVCESTFKSSGDISTIIPASSLLCFPWHQRDKNHKMMVMRAVNACFDIYNEVSKFLERFKSENCIDDKPGIGISIGKVGTESLGCEKRKFIVPFGLPVYHAHYLSFLSNTILCDDEIAKVLRLGKESTIVHDTNFFDAFGRKVFMLRG